ncbi:universal stress protein [Pseudonocardia xishanensis]|uniref:Universal stress protein n=1 Tax=Pseudonocardia xishanensis TaxID=630995 RepID=A0ABP8RTE3_9PSEU
MDRAVIVVGVDGSPESRAALNHALETAARQDAALRVVMAVQTPDYSPEFDCGPPPTPAETTETVERGLRSAVAEARTVVGPLAAAVPVDVEAVFGAPAKALVRAAADADELVVGHRGRGAVAGAVLGSVGRYCVAHAPCTVTVVRALAGAGGRS